MVRSSVLLHFSMNIANLWKSSIMGDAGSNAHKQETFIISCFKLANRRCIKQEKFFFTTNHLKQVSMTTTI